MECRTEDPLAIVVNIFEYSNVSIFVYSLTI